MSPLELSLYLLSFVVGVIMYLLPKNPLVVVGCLIAIFCLLIYPIWHLPWIGKSLFLKSAALFFIAALLSIFGYALLPESKSEEAVKDQPTDFKLSLLGGNIFVADVDSRFTGLVLDVRIRNAGKASIATDWKLFITVPNETPILAQLTQPPPHLTLHGDKNEEIKLFESDFSFEKTIVATPIEYGKIVQGRLLFYVESPKEEIIKKDTVLELKVDDIAGHTFSVTQRMGDWLIR